MLDTHNAANNGFDSGILERTAAYDSPRLFYCYIYFTGVKMSLPKQCNSCGGMCGTGGCKTKSIYPHNWAGKHLDKAKFELLKSVREGCLTGERAKQAINDADTIFNMMLKYKI